MKLVTTSISRRRWLHTFEATGEEHVISRLLGHAVVLLELQQLLGYGVLEKRNYYHRTSDSFTLLAL